MTTPKQTFLSALALLAVMSAAAQQQQQFILQNNTSGTPHAPSALLFVNPPADNETYVNMPAIATNAAYVNTPASNVSLKVTRESICERK